MKITEQNWKEELYKNIGDAHKENCAWVESEFYEDCDCTVYEYTEDFIQSLITSIKQEERERFINLIPNKMRLAVGTHNLFEKGYNSTIDEINEAIQSLTEEDVKDQHGK